MSPADFFGNATVSAIAGGLTAWLATHRIQKSFLKTNSQDAIADIFSELKADARRYWRKRGLDDNLEASVEKLVVKGRERLIRHDKNFLKAKNQEQIKRLSVELHQVLTGGTFATAGRIPDIGR